MPKGRPFICWLSSTGRYHDAALHIGDEVDFNSFDEGWIRAKIGCKRNGLYVARWNKKEEAVFSLTSLRPVLMMGLSE